VTPIMLRTDLKTAGGEVCDIMYNEEFVGTLMLVYRESDRLTGSIQLEEQSLNHDEKEDVYAYLQSYIQNLTDALAVRECEVLATYSDYDFVIATNHALQEPASDWEDDAYDLHDDEMDYEWVRDETRFDDIDPENREDVDMIQTRKTELGYELVIVGEKRNKVSYHVYDRDSEIVAEADLFINGTEIVGDIEWSFDPFEEEMDQVADLLVTDFNDADHDTFVFNMNYNGESIDTIEMTHIELLDADEEVWSEFTTTPDRDDYSIIMARDDGDTLTYEIYQLSYGDLPIGTATIDISEKQITGFIDFREPGNPNDRELIAMLLMEELEKEKDYNTLNLSILYRNKLIEEIMFETEQIH